MYVNLDANCATHITFGYIIELLVLTQHITVLLANALSWLFSSKAHRKVCFEVQKIDDHIFGLLLSTIIYIYLMTMLDNTHTVVCI